MGTNSYKQRTNCQSKPIYFISCVLSHPIKSAVLLSSFETVPWSHQRKDKSWRKAKPQQHTQRELSVLNSEQLFGLPKIQDADCLWVSTDAKMEWKTLAGHLNLCGHTVHRHGKNNRITLKSAIFSYCTFQTFCWTRPLKPLLWAGQAASNHIIKRPLHPTSDSSGQALTCQYSTQFRLGDNPGSETGMNSHQSSIRQKPKHCWSPKL